MTKLNLTPQDFTRIDNDINGNPRYHVSVVSLLPIVDNDSDEYVSILERSREIDYKRKGSSLTKYRGKKFGSGYVIQSYSLQDDCKHLNEFFNK